MSKCKCIIHILFPASDHRIRRQHSSDSMSSINSAASHSSMGSAKDAEDKKKKKKNWVSTGGQGSTGLGVEMEGERKR